MKIYADLHIHSFLSRATSQKMTIAEITRYSRIKGLNMLGTGDALHPAWIKELKTKLDELPGTNLYRTREHGEPIYFVTQAEVATIHRYEGLARRIHHVILMPSLEVAEQLSEALSRYGDMRADGRPTLNITPTELVEITMKIDSRNFVFPAHAWTSRFDARPEAMVVDLRSDRRRQYYGGMLRRPDKTHTRLGDWANRQLRMKLRAMQ